ncbi:MAG: hypothetical protein JJT94_07665 [Bernardetiaceae bacterium]|nr:hypothetical protein [Bernardetiaceae bacterium]
MNILGPLEMILIFTAFVGSLLFMAWFSRRIFSMLVGSKQERKLKEAEIMALREDNRELKERVENLEAILTAVDTELFEGLLKLNQSSPIERESNERVKFKVARAQKAIRKYNKN